MYQAERLGLFIRSVYSARVVALVVTVPVALAWFGYAAWWWFKLADWVEVTAQVDHVEWASESGGGKSSGRSRPAATGSPRAKARRFRSVATGMRDGTRVRVTNAKSSTTR